MVLSSGGPSERTHTWRPKAHGQGWPVSSAYSSLPHLTCTPDTHLLSKPSLALLGFQGLVRGPSRPGKSWYFLCSTQGLGDGWKWLDGGRAGFPLQPASASTLAAWDCHSGRWWIQGKMIRRQIPLPQLQADFLSHHRGFSMAELTD